MRKITRKIAADPIIGKPEELPTADLPTLKNVLRKALLIKQNSIDNLSLRDLAEKLVPLVKLAYQQVNIDLPLIQDRSIYNKILRGIQDWKYLAKTSHKGRKLENFQDKLEELFDIVFCRCKIVSCEAFGCVGCNFGAHTTCTCPQSKKVCFVLSMKLIRLSYQRSAHLLRIFYPFRFQKLNCCLCLISAANGEQKAPCKL